MLSARIAKLLPVALVFLLLASCGTGDGDGPGSTPARALGGTPLDPAEVRGMEAVAGQTIYVPAYSHVYSSDEGKPFHLATTLSVRNADPAHPIVVASVRYFDSDGKAVRPYLDRPIRLAPLASAEFHVAERDTTGGFGASFLVEWLSDRPAQPPVVQAIMIGTARTQGISFVCDGRVVSDRSRGPAEAP